MIKNVLLSLLLIFSYAFPGNWDINPDDPFMEPDCQLMDEYSIYLLRQKATLLGTQAFFETGGIFDDSSGKGESQIVTYLPFSFSNNIAATLSLKYLSSSILSSNRDIERNVRTLSTWDAIGFQNDKWKYVAMGEFYSDGNLDHFSSNGNLYRGFLMAGYAFNRNWQLYLLGGYQVQFMYNVNTPSPLAGVQFRYERDNDFKFMFGFPTVIALDWAICNSVDASICLFAINLEGSCMFRKRLNNDFAISLYYQHSPHYSNISYFSTQTYIDNSKTDTISFTNITQQRHSISFGINKKFTQKIGTILSIGYAIPEKVSLYYNNESKKELQGRNSLFANLFIQFLNPKEY